MAAHFSRFPGRISPGLIEARVRELTAFGHPMRSFPGRISPGLIEALRKLLASYEREPLEGFPGRISPGLIEAEGPEVGHRFE